MEEPDLGYRDMGINTKNREYEVVDSETIKAQIEDQRRGVFKADGNTLMTLERRVTHKTKALTTDLAKLKDFNKIIIYCPACIGAGGTHRMLPYQLKILLDNPEAYSDLVGGLAFEEDTIFLHCKNCNLRLIPTVDEVEKLDAREEDEFEISSLADVNRKTQKPVMAGQSDRWNKARQQKEEQFNKRKRRAQEMLNTDYENKGVKPKE